MKIEQVEEFVLELRIEFPHECKEVAVDCFQCRANTAIQFLFEFANILRS